MIQSDCPASDPVCLSSVPSELDPIECSSASGGGSGVAETVYSTSNPGQIDDSIATAGFSACSDGVSDSGDATTSCADDPSSHDQNSVLGCGEPETHLVERDETEEARVLATKTPISLLTEFVLRDKIKPEFVEVEKVGDPHCLTFTYLCTAGEFSAEAVAKTVKNAKHLAARRVLVKMIEAKPEDYEIFGITGDQTLQFVKSMMPHLDDPTRPKVLNGMIKVPGEVPAKANACVSVNYVGKLQEKCMQTWGPEFIPDYQTVSEAGPPHDRVFTLTCKVHTFEQTADGKSVKGAKKAAAEKMLIFLEQVPPGFLPMKTKAIAAGAPAVPAPPSDSSAGASAAGDPCEAIAAEMAALNVAASTSSPPAADPSATDNTTIASLADMDLENESPSIKHQKLVAKIVRERGWKPIEYTPVEVDKGASDPCQCCVKVNADPPLQATGMGLSAEKAKFASARNLLTLIKENYCK